MKKDRRLKILWNSNAFWSNSGYAQQQAYVLPALTKDGWTQAHIDFYGLEGGIVELEGVKHYPRIADIWGLDAMIEHGKDFNTDITLSNQDIWTLDPNALQHVKRWIPWLPVDHDPIPPAVLQRAKMAYRILAYSKFAQKQLADNGVHSTYLPLMVDTKIFKPYKKDEMRELLGIPKDVFLFGMVAANKDNPPRKSFQEVLDAFAVFHREHPKSAIYFHVAVDNPGGFPINEYVKFLGLNPSVVFYPPPYDLAYKISKEHMAKIYSTFDCLLAPSVSEGWGVPIVEAMACGIPVIANDFTSMTELIEPGKNGYLTEVLYKRFTPLLSYVGVVDSHSLYMHMEQIFKDDRKKMGVFCRLSIMQYDTEYVMKTHLIPFLEKVQAEVYEEDTINSK